jgi:ribonuclease D
MAKEQGLAHFQILHQQVLIQIVANLPVKRMDLKKINGVGKKTLEKYGKDILALVAGYRQERGIGRLKLPDAKDSAGKYVDRRVTSNPSVSLE